MRLLYVGRASGPHDRRFLDAWAGAGVAVSSLFVDEAEQPGRAPGERFASLLRETLARVKPDVVQVGPTTWPGSAVCEAWDGPLIATSWGFDLMHDIDTDEVAREQARQVLRRADLVFVDNDGPERRARELGATAGTIVSFPWGINLAQFSHDSGAARDPYRVVTVRQHEPLYRVADVLDAFAIASAAEPRLRLVLGGAGSLTDSLRQHAVELGIADLVEWPGSLASPELAALLHASGIYISTSPVDGSSVSLLEAMAAGAAVVVTDIEGNRQWVDDTTGWTFAVGDTDGLAALMTALPADPDQVEARRRGAQHRVGEKADWAATASLLPGYAQRAIEAARVRVDRLGGR